MHETISPATEGWYVVAPVYAGGDPVDIKRTPIVAWRIGEGDPVPVLLRGNATLEREGVAIMDPDGVVTTRTDEYQDAREYLDALGARSTEARAPARRVPEPEPEFEFEEEEAPRGAAPRWLRDPELAEEDRVHAPVQLISERGNEFTLHAHEWQKLLTLARSHGWHPGGTIHGDVEDWSGAYDEPHNQLVQSSDAEGLAAALERAMAALPPQKPEAEIAHASDRAVISLSAAEYLGGVKGRPFVEALITFARRGGFRIG